MSACYSDKTLHPGMPRYMWLNISGSYQAEQRCQGVQNIGEIAII